MVIINVTGSIAKVNVGRNLEKCSSHLMHVNPAQPIGLVLTACFGPFFSYRPHSPIPNGTPEEHNHCLSRSSLKRKWVELSPTRFPIRTVTLMADIDEPTELGHITDHTNHRCLDEENTSIDLNRDDCNLGDKNTYVTKQSECTATSDEAERTVQIRNKLGFKITIGDPLLNEILGETSADDVHQ